MCPHQNYLQVCNIPKGMTVVPTFPKHVQQQHFPLLQHQGPPLRRHLAKSQMGKSAPGGLSWLLLGDDQLCIVSIHRRGLKKQEITYLLTMTEMATMLVATSIFVPRTMTEVLWT